MISAASKEDTLITVLVTLLKILAALLMLSSFVEPIICGNSFNSFNAFPSTVRSGADARKKSVPNFNFVRSSNVLIILFLAVPTVTVERIITKSFFFRNGDNSSTTCSICLKFGFLVSSSCLQCFSRLDGF